MMIDLKIFCLVVVVAFVIEGSYGFGKRPLGFRRFFRKGPFRNRLRPIRENQTVRAGPESDFGAVEDPEALVRGLLNLRASPTRRFSRRGPRIFDPEAMNRTITDLDFVKRQIAAQTNSTVGQLGTPLIDDMLIDEPLARQMAEAFEASGRKKREFVNDLARLFPNPTIKYAIFVLPQGTGVTTQIAALIDQAFQILTDNTCLTFTRIFAIPPPAPEDYILFQDVVPSSGQCWSAIGNSAGQHNLINLDPDCNNLGTVLHEIAHALGMYHEQSRQDRECFVDFLLDKIIDERESPNFDSCSLTGCRVSDFPYDYGSVMHYGQYSFLETPLYSFPDDRTILTTDPEFQATIGQRYGYSFYDLKAINNVYCGVGSSTGPQVIPNSPCDADPTAPTCGNDGYNNPASCDECHCGDSFDVGNNCDTRFPGTRFDFPTQETVPAACGADLAGTSSIQTLTSSNNVELGETCAWIITCPAGTVVEYSFTAFQFLQLVLTPSGETYPYCYNNVHLEVRDDDLSNTGPKFCGRIPPPTATAFPTAPELNARRVSSDNRVAFIRRDLLYLRGWDVSAATNQFTVDYRCVKVIDCDNNDPPGSGYVIDFPAVAGEEVLYRCTFGLNGCDNANFDAPFNQCLNQVAGLPAKFDLIRQSEPCPSGTTLTWWVDSFDLFHSGASYPSGGIVTDPTNALCDHRFVEIWYTKAGTGLTKLGRFCGVAGFQELSSLTTAPAGEDWTSILIAFCDITNDGSANDLAGKNEGLNFGWKCEA